MTRAEQLILRGLWALPLAAILLFLLGHLTGEKWPGQTLAVIILVWPPVLLLTVGALKLLKGRRLVATARALAFLALYGILGWIVLAAMAGLVETGDPEKVAAGWALMGLYAAPAVLCVSAVLWFAAARAGLGGAALYYRGLHHAMNDRRAEAAAAFAHYHRSHPDDPRAWEGLAFTMLANHRFEEALDAADTVFRLGKRAMGLWLRGHVFLELGAGEEALAAFEACTRERPKLRLIATATGIALVQLRRLDGAVAVLQGEKGWRSVPHSAFVLGDAYRLRGMPDAALDAYETAARAAAAAEAPFIHGVRDRALLACALAETGRLREAEEAAQSALAADASNPQALHAQALIQRRRGDLPGLVTTIERMLQVSPPAVMSVLGDPEFTPLLADERFRGLLGRAWQERDRILERVRNRPRPDFGGP